MRTLLSFMDNMQVKTRLEEYKPNKNYPAENKIMSNHSYTNLATTKELFFRPASIISFSFFKCVMVKKLKLHIKVTLKTKGNNIDNLKAPEDSLLERLCTLAWNNSRDTFTVICDISGKRIHKIII